MDYGTEYMEMYKIAEVAVNKILDKVRQELRYDSDAAVRIILDESDRAIERVKYRFELSAKLGEKPRPDALPQYQLRRIALFETETSPTFMNASVNHPVDFISSFQAPGDVVTDILETALIKFERAKFKQEFPKVWDAFLEVASQFADDIVAKKTSDKTAMKQKLLDAIE